MERRNVYFDALKGILIICVILGHCLEQFGNSHIERSVCASIYSFHMPLFVMLSGYFCKKIPNWHELFTLIGPLAGIYILFQSFHFIINSDYRFCSIIDVIIYPGFTMWYILSLICWYIISYITPPRLTKNA